MLNLGAMGINRVASDCLSIVGRSHIRLKGMLEFLLPFLSCSAERSFAFPGAFIIGGPIAIWFQPHRWFKAAESETKVQARRASATAAFGRRSTARRQASSGLIDAVATIFDLPSHNGRRARNQTPRIKLSMIMDAGAGRI
jgi:hypothetical protein